MGKAAGALQLLWDKRKLYGHQQITLWNVEDNPPLDESSKSKEKPDNEKFELATTAKTGDKTCHQCVDGSVRDAQEKRCMREIGTYGSVSNLS